MGWLDSFKRKPSAATALAMAIMNAAYQCGQALKDPINDLFGKGSQEASLRWVQVQYEFLFFFTHLVMRTAFSQLGPDFRSKLQDSLGPILESSTTEAWCGHWPAKMKERIRAEFYHNINVAGSEYSKYQKVFAEKDQPLHGTLFWELGKNIARLSGYEHNPAVVMLSITVSIDQFKTLELTKLVDAASRVM